MKINYYTVDTTGRICSRHRTEKAAYEFLLKNQSVVELAVKYYREQLPLWSQFPRESP